MIDLIALGFLALFGALIVGQTKVILTAVQNRKAGIGRFSYKLDEHPIGFWTILLIETAALVFVALYALSALGIIVT